nr:MAG TPA: hypothetical protein [Bacteriophage sp.]
MNIIQETGQDRRLTTIQMYYMYLEIIQTEHLVEIL